MWTYSPSANQSWCTPRECGPEQSTKAIDFGLLRLGDVEQLEAGRLLADLLALVGDRHHLVGDLQRIGAHVALRQVGLADHLGLARIGDVDRGEILRRALVRQPDDAPAVGRDLDRHAFAHAAEAVERVLGEQLEVPGDRIVGALLQRAVGDGHCLLPPIVRAGCSAFSTVGEKDRRRSIARRHDIGGFTACEGKRAATVLLRWRFPR